MPEMNTFSLIVIFSSKEVFYADNAHCFHSLHIGNGFFLLEVDGFSEGMMCCMCGCVCVGGI